VETEAAEFPWSAAVTHVDDPQSSRRYGTAIATGLGIAFGVLPHGLGLALGMANFLVTPFLMPALAVAAGWWLGRTYPQR